MKAVQNKMQEPPIYLEEKLETLIGKFIADYPKHSLNASQALQMFVGDSYPEDELESMKFAFMDVASFLALPDINKRFHEKYKGSASSEIGERLQRLLQFFNFLTESKLAIAEMEYAWTQSGYIQDGHLDHMGSRYERELKIQAFEKSLDAE